GPDPGLVHILERGNLQAGQRAPVLRQAVRARLPPWRRVEQGAPRARIARGGRARHERAVSRVLPPHRRQGARVRFVARVLVRPKAEVRDPQGEAVFAALRSLGHDVFGVRTGKEIVVTFDAADERAAREAAERMGDQLLANPVIESYEVTLEPAAAMAR